MTILDRLADHARRRTEQAKRKTPLAALERQALSMPKGGFAFEAALKKPGLSFICECKRASPSKGLIAPAYPYLQIAGEYEAAGADAVSVLTEPKWFLGSDEHLKEIADAVSVPCLRKDFTVDAYMIYEARLLGASAVLLICAILTDAELRAYLAICDALGLSALVEAHEEREVRDGAGRRRPRHRCEQPQPQGLYGGRGEQPPAARADSAGGPVCLGERRPGRRRYTAPPRHRRRRRTGRGNADAFAG